MNGATRFLAGSTGDRELALTMYRGVVLEQFYNDQAFYDRTGQIIDYQNVGPGAAFQYIQEADLPAAEYFTPGNEMTGQAFGYDQVLVAPDDPIVSHGKTPGDQVLMAHFPVISRKGRGHVRKIREEVNRKLAIMHVLAARTPAKTKTVDGQTLTLHRGGNVTTISGGTLALAFPRNSTGAQKVREVLLDQARQYDEKNYDSLRWAFISPYLLEVLQYDPQVFDRNLSSIPGDLATRVVAKVAGFALVPTNTIPSNNNVDPRFSKYNGDFRDQTSGGATGRPAIITTAGARDGKAAVGLVESGGLMSAAKYIEEQMSTFTFAGLIAGMGVVCPESAGEVRVIT